MITQKTSTCKDKLGENKVNDQEKRILIIG